MMSLFFKIIPCIVLRLKSFIVNNRKLLIFITLNSMLCYNGGGCDSSWIGYDYHVTELLLLKDKFVIE